MFHALNLQPKFVRGGLLPAVMNECFDELEAIQDELRRWALGAEPSSLRSTALYRCVVKATNDIDRVERIIVPRLLFNVGVDYHLMVPRRGKLWRKVRHQFCLYLLQRMADRMTELSVTKHESRDVKKAALQLKDELLAAHDLLVRVELPQHHMRVDKSTASN